MKIYAPVKDFNGLRNNVRFVNGVGETDNPALLPWFKSHGYKVPIDDGLRVEQAATIQPTGVVEDAETVNQPDFDSMTADELRNWGRANGFGAKIRNTRNKEKLLEIIRG